MFISIFRCNNKVISQTLVWFSNQKRFLKLSIKKITLNIFKSSRSLSTVLAKLTPIQVLTWFLDTKAAFLPISELSIKARHGLPLLIPLLEVAYQPFAMQDTIDPLALDQSVHFFVGLRMRDGVEWAFSMIAVRLPGALIDG